MANTQVILVEKNESLGDEGDIVSVRRGFARNYLIPQGKALEVVPSSLRQINHLKAKRAEREAHELTVAQGLRDKINNFSFSFELETGKSGKAFGSITAKDIMERLLKELPSISLPKHAVVLDRSIKEVGDKKIEVKLHPEVSASLRISVNSPKNSEETSSTEDVDASSASKKVRKKSSGTE